MPNGAPRPDPAMHIAALQERVHGLGQQFLNFEQATTRSFQQVEAALATLSAEVRAGGKTQWQTIVTSVGVLVAILGAIGTLAYLPIKNNMDQLTGDLRIIRTDLVPRSELVERWRRTEDEIKANRDDLLRHEGRSVLRLEHEERARSVDRRFSELQRQIDEMKRGGRAKAGEES